MQVAFIHPDYPNSEGTGATHSATQIVECLETLGYDITVYCTTRPPSDLQPRCEYIDPDGGGLHSATALNREIKARTEELAEFDVVHSYLQTTIPALHHLAEETTTSTLVTLNAFSGICPKNDLLYMDEVRCRDNSTLRCVKCSVLTSGGHDEYGFAYRSIGRLAQLRLIKKFDPGSISIDGYQALSRHVKRTYGDFGFDPDRIRIIPNILDERFDVEHRSDFSEPYRLLYVGALENHKGVQMLPEIVSTLDREQEFDFRLTVVGTGGLRSEIEDAFADLNVSHRVSFRGFVANRDLPAIYAEHDLFLYPGICDEAFGRVFIEALAAGTPVVSTDRGSIESIIGDAGLVTEATPKALARTVSDAIHSSRLPELAANADSEARKFSASNVGEQFRSLYRELTGS